MFSDGVILMNNSWETFFVTSASIWRHPLGAVVPCRACHDISSEMYIIETIHGKKDLSVARLVILQMRCRQPLVLKIAPSIVISRRKRRFETYLDSLAHAHNNVKGFHVALCQKFPMVSWVGFLWCSTIIEISGETVRMCMLVWTFQDWSFCVKYLFHMSWLICVFIIGIICIYCTNSWDLHI